MAELTGVKATEPTEPKGPTLADAIRDMDANMKVEPVETEEPEEQTAETEDAGHDTTPEPVEAEAPEEVEAEPEDDSEPDEGEEEQEGAPEVLRLQLQTKDGNEVEVELTDLDDETREAVSLLQDRAKVAEEMAKEWHKVRAIADRQQQNEIELAFIEEELKEDPAGYLTQRVRPEIRAEVVKELLLNDDVLQAVEDVLEEWSHDPAIRRELAADLKVKRVERSQERRQQKEIAQKNQQQAREIYNEIEGMVDPAWDAETQRMFVADAVNDVTKYVNRNKIDSLDPSRLPEVLASRMRQYGVKAPAAASKRPRAVGRSPEGGSGPVDAASAREAGRKIQSKVARRKRAAGTPAGATGSPGGIKLPKGAKLEDALQALRARTRR